MDDEIEKDIQQKERVRIREQTEIALELRLPPIEIDENERPFGRGSLSLEDLDLSFLINERQKHQTRQAEQGSRTRLNTNQTDKSDQPTSHTARRTLLKGLQEVLREQ